MTEHANIQRLNSNQVMSAVTIHQQTVYLSGQVPDSTYLDIEGQTKEVLAKIDQLLELAGTDKSRLLSAQLFVKNLADFQQVNALWINWMEGCGTPARATIQADLVNPDWLIEIAVIAAQA
ncbi:RidA family protein [Acinetobacter sp. RF15A]|uniref:RidA family protein n=1 Tax=unclassified Acinetobacter TaxID=196816 RepID=UPI00118FCBB6|nr:MULTISPECIES: RidA family protein [unclassified Acinetobacter]TSH73892.1 RidA family protein [Acinetobacter sp. RF15A]TSI17180.1 RidA family protein [Acinetobacter sp. RF15B]